MYECRIECDSLSPAGHRLTTFVCTFPRMILAELNTTRQFSRSSASSRAIPVEKQLKKIEEDLFFPVYWGKNQKGMSASEELSPSELLEARRAWFTASLNAVDSAKVLGAPFGLDVHKQTTNRLLEPFMWHTAIITATDWDNHWHLRDHLKAQPEYQVIARLMHEAYRAGMPTRLVGPPHFSSAWHLPFKQAGENTTSPSETEDLIRQCIGRAARVSYLNHDGTRAPEADLKLSGTLFNAGHMAPYEHVARAMTGDELELFGRDEIVPDPEYEEFTASSRPGTTRFMKTGRKTHYLGNFNGFVQARKMIPYENDALGPRSS